MSRPGRIAALLLAAGAVWLILAAGPAFADGGPHQLTLNNGTAGLSGDCAACHRAHTAQAADLLKAAVPGLCLTCHDGTGATTDVVDGVQFVPTSWTGTPASDPVLGALRGGGFSYALLDSGNAARLISNGIFLGKVRVLTTGAPVTSSHLGAGTVWGNGPDGTAGPGAGPVTLTCTSCHNPHGNGLYRILQATPGEDWSGTGVPGWIAPADSVEVQDIPDPSGGTRNYTVLPGTLATDAAAYAPSQGDYWRLRAPWNLNTGSKDPMQAGWNGFSPTNAAANGGIAPANATGLMTAWCIQCHTRYSGLINDDGASSSMAAQPDVIFTYRHLTMNYGCEQCHVSHGSNAQMTAPASLSLPNPGDTAAASGDSRLLKVDNRGTCQLCHDPTGTAGNGYSGPVPTPGVP